MFCLSANTYQGSLNECYAWANDTLGEDFFKMDPEADPQGLAFIAVSRDAQRNVIYDLTVIDDKEAFLIEQRDGPIDLMYFLAECGVSALKRQYRASLNKSAAAA